MTWILKENGKSYDLVPTHVEGKPSFTVEPHKTGSLYPDYLVNALVNEATRVARKKYYWGMRYFDPETGKVRRARSIKEYCNAFLFYVLHNIGPVVAFPKSKHYDHIVKSKIEFETENMFARHKLFRKVSRKYRRYARKSDVTAPTIKTVRIKSANTDISTEAPVASASANANGKSSIPMKPKSTAKKSIVKVCAGNVSKKIPVKEKDHENDVIEAEGKKTRAKAKPAKASSKNGKSKKHTKTKVSTIARNAKTATTPTTRGAP